jgi:hypothetical protein
MLVRMAPARMTMEAPMAPAKGPYQSTRIPETMGKILYVA